MKKLILISILSTTIIILIVTYLFINNEKNIEREKVDVPQTNEEPIKQEELKTIKKDLADEEKTNINRQKLKALFGDHVPKTEEDIRKEQMALIAEKEEKLRLQKIKDEQALIARDKRIKEEEEREKNRIQSLITWQDKENGVAKVFQSSDKKIKPEFEFGKKVIESKQIYFPVEGFIENIKAGLVKKVYIEDVMGKELVFDFDYIKESKLYPERNDGFTEYNFISFKTPPKRFETLYMQISKHISGYYEIKIKFSSGLASHKFNFDENNGVMYISRGM